MNSATPVRFQSWDPTLPICQGLPVHSTLTPPRRIRVFRRQFSHTISTQLHSPLGKSDSSFVLSYFSVADGDIGQISRIQGADPRLRSKLSARTMNHLECAPDDECPPGTYCDGNLSRIPRAAIESPLLPRPTRLECSPHFNHDSQRSYHRGCITYSLHIVETQRPSSPRPPRARPTSYQAAIQGTTRLSDLLRALWFLLTTLYKTTNRLLRRVS